MNIHNRFILPFTKTGGSTFNFWNTFLIYMSLIPYMICAWIIQQVQGFWLLLNRKAFNIVLFSSLPAAPHISWFNRLIPQYGYSSNRTVWYLWYRRKFEVFMICFIRGRHTSRTFQDSVKEIQNWMLHENIWNGNWKNLRTLSPLQRLVLLAIIRLLFMIVSIACQNFRDRLVWGLWIASASFRRSPSSQYPVMFQINLTPIVITKMMLY